MAHLLKQGGEINMSKLSEYFSKSTGVETKDTTPTTKVEELKEITHLESDEEFSEKLKEKVEELKAATNVVKPPKLVIAKDLYIPGTNGFIGPMEDDDQLKAMKALLTVEEYEILQDTNRLSSKERILKYVSAIQKLIDHHIFDDENDEETK
jgi:uncharacterized protein YfeS